MSVSLSQTPAASFPDRPRVSQGGQGIGLHIALAAGNDGALLEHDLGGTPDPLHVRFMLRNATATDGRVVLMRGLDASSSQTFSVLLDTDARQITCELATGENLVADLLHPIAWQAVEVMIDRTSGDAALFINGIERTAASGTFTSLQTQSVQLGGIYKDTAVTGDLFIDEVVFSTDYIGPVVVEPVSDFADDPARWLVIFNENSADAVTFAENYRAARDVPFANLLGLDCSTSETIDSAATIAINDAIDQYLLRHDMTQNIIGLLFGHGVPGNMDITAGGLLTSIPSLLTFNGAGPGTISNPLFVDDEPTRPSIANLAGLRLTARIDGPDLAASNSIITRATELMTQGIGDGAASTIFLDPWTTPGGLADDIMQSMFDWSQSISRMTTRLPIALSAAVDPQSDVQFPSIAQDGFFWGWQQSSPPDGFFGEPAGSRVFAVQLSPSASSAANLRSATPTNWAEVSLHEGYAAAAGTVYPMSMSSVPAARPFFAALRRGWTLAEAWFVALPVLRDAIHLVGDPLMTIATPRAGWDIYGPLTAMENMNADGPAHALRDDQMSLPLPASLLPNEGDDAVYVIHHVDDHGRSEQGATHVRVRRVVDQLLPVPARPIFPLATNWPAMIEDGEARLTAAWDQPILRLGVTRIELQAHESGGPTITIDSHTPTTGERHHTFTQPLPAFATQYRMRCLNAQGVDRITPWSAPMVAKVETPVAMQWID